MIYLKEANQLVVNGSSGKKLRPDGSIEKYKARLVTKGFSQKKGIDYFDIYSPVIGLSTIRVLLALASIYNLEIHQMDV